MSDMTSMLRRVPASVTMTDTPYDRSTTAVSDMMNWYALRLISLGNNVYP